MAIASAEYLKVCKKVAGKKQCKILMNDLIGGTLTPSGLFRKVREKVQRGSKEAKQLDEIDELIVMEFQHVRKSKKKKKNKR